MRDRKLKLGQWTSWTKSTMSEGAVECLQWLHWLHWLSKNGWNIWTIRDRKIKLGQLVPWTKLDVSEESMECLHWLHWLYKMVVTFEQFKILSYRYCKVNWTKIAAICYWVVNIFIFTESTDFLKIDSDDENQPFLVINLSCLLYARSRNPKLKSQRGFGHLHVYALDLITFSR